MPKRKKCVPTVIYVNEPDPHSIWEVMAQVMTEYCGKGKCEYYIVQTDDTEKKVDRAG